MGVSAKKLNEKGVMGVRAQSTMEAHPGVPYQV